MRIFNERQVPLPLSWISQSIWTMPVKLKLMQQVFTATERNVLRTNPTMSYYEGLSSDVSIWIHHYLQGRSWAEAERPGPQLQNVENVKNSNAKITVENVWRRNVELGLNIKTYHATPLTFATILLPRKKNSTYLQRMERGCEFNWSWNQKCKLLCPCVGYKLMN